MASWGQLNRSQGSSSIKTDSSRKGNNMAQQAQDPISKLNAHYEKSVLEVVEMTKVKALALSTGDVDAIEGACTRWVAALRGILRVRDTILAVIGEKLEEEENIEIEPGDKNLV